MIDERYQMSAMPKEGGERVIGYICPFFGINNMLDGLRTKNERGGYHTIRIDPATIEPVRVKPIFKPATDIPSELYCPNCNYDLMGGVEENPEHDPPYCWECGQALDWSNPT